MRTRKRDIARAEELILPVAATLKLLNEPLEEEQTLPRVSSLRATPRRPHPPPEHLWPGPRALRAPPNAIPGLLWTRVEPPDSLGLEEVRTPSRRPSKRLDYSVKFLRPTRRWKRGPRSFGGLIRLVYTVAISFRRFTLIESKPSHLRRSHRFA
jgi:hypothetical protein